MARKRPRRMRHLRDVDTSGMHIVIQVFSV